MAIRLGSSLHFWKKGQKDHWSTSVFIEWFYVCGNFHPSLYYLRARQQNSDCQSALTPYLQLRLGLGINFIMGGVNTFVFLLPGYLEQVQNYSASQTAEAMVPIGLPYF